MTFDIRTISFLILFTSFIIAGGIFIVSRKYSFRMHGAYAWMLSNGFQFLGWTFVSLRDYLPDLLTIVFGNLFLYLTYIFYFVALKRFFRSSFLRWPLVGSSVGVFLGLGYFCFIQPDINMRVFIISISATTLWFANANLIWKKRHAISGFSAWITIIGFVVPGISFAIRSYLIFLPAHQVDTLFSPGWLQNLTFFSLFFNILIAALGFLLLLYGRFTEELQYRATHDSLTGISEHGTIISKINEEIQIHLKTQQPLSLLMIDIDNFKQVNDQYGHLVGDETLIKVAGLLSRTLSDQGKLGRYGGDEFLAVLPAMSKEATRKIVDNIHSEFELLAEELPVTPDRIRLSIGVAELDHHTETLDSLIHRADQAMYAQKHRQKKIGLPITGA